MKEDLSLEEKFKEEIKKNEKQYKRYQTKTDNNYDYEK